VPGPPGATSVDWAAPPAVTTLVEAKTCWVQAASLNRRKVTEPVGVKAPTRVAESWTRVPGGPPAEGEARMPGVRLLMVMVKVWHTGGLTPSLAHTVVGP
jgi:hypothetical protein